MGATELNENRPHTTAYILCWYWALFVLLRKTKNLGLYTYRTNVASVGETTRNDKEKIDVSSEALCRELVVGGLGKPRVFLYELI